MITLPIESGSNATRPKISRVVWTGGTFVAPRFNFPCDAGFSCMQLVITVQLDKPSLVNDAEAVRRLLSTLCDQLPKPLTPTRRNLDLKDAAGKLVGSARVFNSNKPTAEQRFWANVKKTDTCWLWTGFVHGQYGKLSVNNKQTGAHRFSYELHKGKLNNWALHTCDNKLCVNPDHLYDGDNDANSYDSALRGRSVNGERHNFAKLTSKQAAHILRLTSSGIRYKDIATLFGISASHVYHIKKGCRWRHLQPSIKPKNKSNQHRAIKPE